VKKLLAATTALIALPLAAQAQSLQPGGFYVGAGGGVNWLFNTSSNATVSTPTGTGNFGWNLNTNTGFVADAMIGYDFIGPRVEVEGAYRDNPATVTVPGTAIQGGADYSQWSVMANAYYDFFAGGTFVPYIGAGLGATFPRLQTLGAVSGSTQFAYQGMIGVGWNLDPMFRINLEGRYFGSTQPSYSLVSGGNSLSGNFSNNNIAVMASLHMRFPPPAAAPPPPAPAPQATSFMVFFDWDRSNLSQQALATIQQAANAFRTRGSARITATGHTDTSGPENYNMALSLRRANAVKDALVRDGVPATAIAVIGKGETSLLVPTPDGVREPQNRRVEIVLQ
jgi:outer membrane protein OmpA-like peptidoglycan-associated protein